MSNQILFYWNCDLHLLFRVPSVDVVLVSSSYLLVTGVVVSSLPPPPPPGQAVPTQQQLFAALFVFLHC